MAKSATIIGFIPEKKVPKKDKDVEKTTTKKAGKPEEENKEEK